MYIYKTKMQMSDQVVSMCSKCFTPTHGCLGKELYILAKDMQNAVGCGCRRKLKELGWRLCCGRVHNPPGLEAHHKSGTCTRWCSGCETSVFDFGRHECPAKDNVLGTCGLCGQLCYNVGHRYCSPSEKTETFVCGCGEDVPLANPFLHWKECKDLRRWPNRMAGFQAT